MEGSGERRPHIERLFQRFLNDEQSAKFIHGVAQQYTYASLSRLATCGSRLTRRGAVLAIGFLSGFEANDVLGARMRDSDRGVRLLAETGLREIWLRDGNEAQRHQIRKIVRLNTAGEFDEASQLASQLISDAPRFAEAWNQRGIARFNLQQYRQSVSDCRQTLRLNPYHFAAAVGMAHGYIELNDAAAALESLQLALQVNPELEQVRIQESRLRKALEQR
ncbi:MAG TPA: hypothetical protein DCY79_09585 [Planctomycetaceae bacterium]|nr:hypothetical protein [Blastopirellula sp.]HAY80040.1 hypothetical protein [Planctomycetaceae bacterium]